MMNTPPVPIGTQMFKPLRAVAQTKVVHLVCPESQPLPLAQALSLKIDAFNLHAVAHHGQASELVASSLEEVLQEIRVSPQIENVVHDLLAADVPSRLIACLSNFDFEAKKSAARVVAAILKSGLRSSDGAQAQATNYVLGHPRFRKLLLDGCSTMGIYHHCAEILRICIRSTRKLAAVLLEDGALGELLGLAQHSSFDISSEAFSSLRELLLVHKGVSSAYIMANFDEFFKLYHTLLQVEDNPLGYVTQRQALKLLAEMLLDRRYLEVMVQYVNRVEFLQLHMNLLRHSSATIRLDAFHLFKIFVANPKKPRAANMIFARNRDRLITLLRSLETCGSQDKTLYTDLGTVMDILSATKMPPSKRAAEN